jgi:hypothetical protein
MIPIESLAEYINTSNDFSPNGLHATLSYDRFPYARGMMEDFFNDPKLQYLTYGWSSGQMRQHIIYRHTDGLIYVVHYAYGEFTDAFYFTYSEMAQYFEDFEHEIPKYVDPPAVIAALEQDGY